MNVFQYIIFLIGSYLLGAIPVGFIYSLLLGVDIRKVGSGNIGATNVSRQFGFLKGFVPVFMLDFLKGATPVFLVNIFGVNFIDKDLAAILTGFSAALGHIFPIYLKFKGGKGVATFAGVYFLLAPLQSLLGLITFIFVLILSRSLSFFSNKQERMSENSFKIFFKGLQKNVWLSSIAAVLGLPIFVFLIEPHRKYLLVLSLITFFIIIYSHRKNIMENLKKK